MLNQTLELYVNGDWGKPCSCFKNEFETETEAVWYFEDMSKSIHS